MKKNEYEKERIWKRVENNFERGPWYNWKKEVLGNEKLLKSIYNSEKKANEYRFDGEPFFFRKTLKVPSIIWEGKEITWKTSQAFIYQEKKYAF